MHYKGLSLFTRTSGRRNFNIASFHSRHSLTWSWILSLQLPSSVVLKPHAGKYRSDPYHWGLHAGLGGLLSFGIGRDNNGVQWNASICFLHFQWHRQRPMYYRDMYQRVSDERDAARHEVYLMGAKMREWAESSSAGRS